MRLCLTWRSQHLTRGPFLGIELFREEQCSDPPLKCKKCQPQLKLALLAKEDITISTLHGPQPEQTQLQLLANSNALLNMNWEKKDAKVKWKLELSAAMNP